MRGHGRVLLRVEPYLSTMKRACATLSAASLATPHFSTLSHTRNYFPKNVTQHKKCVLIPSTTFIRRIQRDIVTSVKTSSSKVPVILVEFSRQCGKNLNYQIS